MAGVGKGTRFGFRQGERRALIGVFAACVGCVILTIAREQARPKAELAIPLRVWIDDHAS
jgi:hypothetical protein